MTNEPEKPADDEEPTAPAAESEDDGEEDSNIEDDRGEAKKGSA